MMATFGVEPVAVILVYRMLSKKGSFAVYYFAGRPCEGFTGIGQIVEGKG